jgi:hypothetical protein
MKYKQTNYQFAKTKPNDVTGIILSVLIALAKAAHFTAPGSASDNHCNIKWFY